MTTATIPNHKTRLTALRALLKKNRLDAYLVPRQDEFQGEYVSAYAERLKWLSGFSGSWGLAIITQSEAAIFVDGRYTVQVREQIDTRLFKPMHLIENPPHKWIEANLKKGSRLGFDPWLTTIADADKFQAACKLAGASLVPTPSNLIDQIWEDQPARPTNPIDLHPLDFAGKSAADKLADCSKAISSANAEIAFIAEPSSIAWLFNIRGRDIPFTPVVPAYALLRKRGKAEIYIDPAKFPAAVREELAEHATIKKPESIEKSLAAIGKKKVNVLVDASSTPDAIRRILAKSKACLVTGLDPCTMPKARKNPTELQGARSAHLRDGAAMINFLYWLEQETSSQVTLNEVEAAGRLKAFRETSNLLADLSFETIPASGPNAAIPHHHANQENPRQLQANEIFLIDSGGNYRDGTTDITRSVIIGQPTNEMRDRFTRVLKGMIEISLLRFPAGTTGAHIDAFARTALWKAGLDYDHGTGHGVGSFLSVHEGPARISKASNVVLQQGMILSNEPGYYKQGEYGIRIENLLVVTEPEAIEGGDRPMHAFETLTLCPIDRRLIDTRLLTREELDWLDTYHARVWRELRPLVDGPLANWLTKACGPLR
jgi:Xaa-Pro aminopeptidase